MSKNIKRLFSISFALFLIMNYYAFIKGDAFNIKQAFNELYVYEENQYNFDDYYLEFNNNLSTKNFEQIFNKFQNLEYEIKKVYLIVNTNYNEELNKKLSEYSFDNINNFINYYISNLKKYNLDDDINNINVYGIKIDKILIYTTKANIEEISNKIKDSKYKNKEI